MFIAIWSVPGVVSGLGLYHSRPAISLADALLSSMLCWYIWVPLTPVVLFLAGRIPFDHGRLGVGIALHSAVALAVAIPHAALSVVVDQLIAPSSQGASVVGLAELVSPLLMDVLAYTAVVATGLALDYRRRFGEGQALLTTLEAKLSRAQLQALKMQLHPHFLFNTLHAVGVLVRKRETRGALRMLIGLSDLLRITLDNAGKQVVTLRKELDFLDRYRRVEQVRFGDRLDIDMKIDRDVLAAMVPNLVLQPVLENAIRHGIAPRDASGTITVSARRVPGERLLLEVCDDGVGLAEDSAELCGMGLANVRARLDQLYGSEHRFDISDREDGEGVVASIEIPLLFEGDANSHD